MAWRRPPKDATDQLLAEEYHLYKAAPGRPAAPSVTKVLKPLTDADMLAQAKAKLTASIAALEDDQRPQRTKDHRAKLQSKYDGWKPWQHAKYPKIDLFDDAVVYFDWLRMEATRRWEARADLGTRVHDHTFHLSTGSDVDAQDDELPYLTAWERYVEENGVEFLAGAIERVVLHPAPFDDPTLEYGGRDDLFAIHHAGPLQGVICGDYKTGNHYPTKVTLQLSGYMNGHGFATYDAGGTLLDAYDPIPEADFAVAIYLRGDGTYEAWNAPVTPAVYDAFLDLREHINFCKTMKPYEDEAEAAWQARKSA